MLAILREGGPATGRTVLDALHTRGAHVTYTTAATVLSRLHARGIVSRRREPHRGAYRYVYASLGLEGDVLRSMAEEIVTLARRLAPMRDEGVTGIVRHPGSGSFRSA